MARDQAYQYAKRRIVEAAKWNNAHLDLQLLGLSELPDELWQLKQLRHLDVSHNQLAVVPELLGQLTSLEQLNVSYNQLTALPDALGRLTQLGDLDVSGNLLTVLPETMEQLTKLHLLNSSGNRLTALPRALRKWTQLQQLIVSNNQLAILPGVLGQLAQLHGLAASNNQLTALPETMLDLYRLRELCLHGNPHLGLPDEVLGPPWAESGLGNRPKPPREILDYYFSTRGSKGRALNELRLIVVGRPKSGKTTLIKRLRGEPMKLNEVETHGIDIQPLNLHCTEGKLLARVWDFGGQHVLHAMHEFFLRQRCLYLLVVEQRTNDVERDLTYWLQLLRSYAGDAPVVVALNQSKGISRPLARAALERDYAPIVAWVATECSPESEVPGANATIENLRRALTDAAAAMPEPKKLFPVKWLEIKKWLEGMKEPFLDYKDYAKRCAELHEDDPKQQEALAAAMDELGVALNYARDPRLHDTTVLRPNWLANGIYALLRANILTPHPLVPDAVLTVERVGEILEPVMHFVQAGV